ncbi:MAG: hypothetical protein M0C28_21220 [Candidatus Moduliflexus flocculans]|nr:hypothetical protein [Candidatus Moduliflexus flocculans]
MAAQTLLPRLGELAVAALDREGFCSPAPGENPRRRELGLHRHRQVADGIDWFELSPEIRCNGELLAVEEIRRAPRRTGRLVRGAARYLLADEQRRVLELLTGGAAGKCKGEAENDGGDSPHSALCRYSTGWSSRSHGVTPRLAAGGGKAPGRPDPLLDRIPERLPGRGSRPNYADYQKEGSDWLAFLYEHRFGACLADDMGLGKTVQAIYLPGRARRRRHPPRRETRAPVPISSSCPLSCSSTGRARSPASTRRSRSSSTPGQAGMPTSRSRHRPHHLRHRPAGHRTSCRPSPST